MIAIIVLWIILGIIALIVILLHFSVRIYVDAGNQGADIKVKYLFFTVFKLNTSDMKKKKTTEKPPDDDALAEETKEKSAQSEKQFEDSLTIELEELDKLDEEESEAAVDGSEPVQVSEELPEECRVFSILTLIPGASIGYHVHEGETELFYFLDGNGRVKDDDHEYDVSAGDSMATFSGHGHGVENTGDTNLVLLACIIKD